MKLKVFVSGLRILEVYNETDLPDGTLCGFDTDHGEIVAYDGKLIYSDELPEGIKIIF